MRWPSKIWYGMPDIFLNSGTRHYGNIKKHWTTGERRILVTEYWRIRVLSFRDIMLAQEVFRKYIFVCDRNNEIEVHESFLLYQRHVFDVPFSVKCCMYYVFHHTPHSVPAGQIDCFLNVTIKVHHEIKFTEDYPSKVFICMQNGNQKAQLGSVWVLDSISVSIFKKYSLLYSSVLVKRYQPAILHF